MDHSDYWDDYTDHIPVESQLRYFPRWKSEPRTEDTEWEKPNVAKLGLSGEESKQLQRNWQSRINQEITSRGGGIAQLDWETIVEICHITSKEVLGTVPPHRKRPHLQGHEEANRKLDREVSEALAKVRSFRNDPIPRCEEREQAYQKSVTESRRVAKRRKTH